MGNALQASSIRRYHLHLQRQGRSDSVEFSARRWIARYAALWRAHFDGCDKGPNPERAKAA